MCFDARCFKCGKGRQTYEQCEEDVLAGLNGQVGWTPVPGPQEAHAQHMHLQQHIIFVLIIDFGTEKSHEGSSTDCCSWVCKGGIAWFEQPASSQVNAVCTRSSEYLTAADVRRENQ